MPLQLVPTTHEDLVPGLGDHDEVVCDEPMSALHEIEDALALADAAIAHEQEPDAVHVRQRSVEGGRGRERELQERLQPLIEFLRRLPRADDGNPPPVRDLDEVGGDGLGLRYEDGGDVEGEQSLQPRPSFGLVERGEIGHFRLADDLDPVCQGTQEVCPDADGDGFADCDTDPNCDPTGLVCGDCDDAVEAVNPNATETCDSLDNNCDGSIDEGFDQDDDGYTACDQPVADCDDGDPTVSPGATEACGDSIDNDCDPSTPDIFDDDGDGATCDVDCDDSDPALNLDDADSDTVTTCGGDCDDTNPWMAPGLPELCGDELDNDCDPGTPDVFDGDGDGASCLLDCDDTNPALNLADADTDTFSTCDGDCNDADPAVNPAATEICDNVDNDCDSLTDEGFDQDDDGFTVCQLPAADCDDGDPTVNPGAAEVCNDGRDNDCNSGTPDLFDADSDGANCDVDCNDGDPSSYPGATEWCDGNDNACQGSVPADETDPDGDAYVACSGWNDVQGDNPEIAGGDDCATSDPYAFPGAAANETFPGACMRDADEDDFGDLSPPAGVTPGTDCDDQSATTFPGAAEIEGPLNCMKDSDGDGYGDDSVSLPVVPGTDCDDDEPTTYPGAPETCDDGVDSDCDGLDPPCDPRGGAVQRQRGTRQLEARGGRNVTGRDY